MSNRRREELRVLLLRSGLWGDGCDAPDVLLELLVRGDLTIDQVAAAHNATRDDIGLDPVWGNESEGA